MAKLSFGLLILVASFLFLLGCGGGKSSSETLSILDLSSTGTDPQVGQVNKNQKPSGVVVNGSSDLLKNLKDQFYRSNVYIVEKPEDGSFVTLKSDRSGELETIFSAKKKKETSFAVSYDTNSYSAKYDGVNESVNFKYRGYYYAYDFTRHYGSQDNFAPIFIKVPEGAQIKNVATDHKELLFHVYEDKNIIGFYPQQELKMELAYGVEGQSELSKLNISVSREDYEIYAETTDGVGISVPTSTENTSSDAAGSNDGDKSFTGTNNQVAEVDEADKVKTDGDFIYYMKESTLNRYQVSSKEIKSFDLKFELNKSLEDGKGNSSSGNTAIASDFVSDEYYQYFTHYLHLIGDKICIVSVGSGTYLSFISISDETMTLDKQYFFNDYYSNSRVIQNKLFLSIGSSIYPNKQIEGLKHYAFTLEQKEQFEGQNQELLKGLTLKDFNIFLEYSLLSGGVVSEGDVGEENDIQFVEGSGGTYINKLMVIDGNGDIGSTLPVAMDYSENMYVTKDHIYLYNTTWNSRVLWWDMDWVQEYHTAIYRFHFDGNQIIYRDSIEVEGQPLNPYSFYQKENTLWVATNDFIQQTNHLSSISLEENMVSVGNLKDISKNEQIQSVRYIGDRAYIVTFRRTDPLFTIDISDRANPLILGELKVTGYSSYLHPISETVLLGVGFSGLETGQITGGKISTFDIANDSEPKEISALELNTRSFYFEATNDPHTFQWAPWLNIAASVANVAGKTELYLTKVSEDGKIVGVARIEDGVGNRAYSYQNSRALFINETLFYLNNGELFEYDTSKMTFQSSVEGIKSDFDQFFEEIRDLVLLWEGIE